MYNFDNVSVLGENDTRVVDVSGHGNNGTVVGGNVSISNGRYGKAMQFNGTPYLDVGNVSGSFKITLTNIHPFTISAWVYPGNVLATGNQIIHLTFNNNANLVYRDNDRFDFRLDWSDGTYVLPTFQRRRRIFGFPSYNPAGNKTK